MRHPWLVKAMGRFDPARHPRGQPENAGEFASAGAAASPGSRHNPDLDAAMGMGAPPAKPAARPAAPDAFADYVPGTQDVRQFPRGAGPARGKPTASTSTLPALPHERTQRQALHAAQAVKPGDARSHAAAVQSLDAHLKAGLAELHRRAAHAGPRAGNMYRKAAEAFRAKMSAARAKVDQLAGRGPPPVPRRPGQGPPPLADRGKVRPWVSMKGLRHPWLVTKAAPASLALDLAVPHPWLVKSRDATGHEHAADGRFGAGAGHGKVGGGAAGGAKPGRMAGRTAARTADPDAKARTLVAKIKAVPAAVRQKVTAFVTGRYQKLSARYGRNGARAILGATILLLPAPVPGSSLIPVAFAEVALRLRRAVMKGGPLDAKTIRAEARALWADVLEHMKGTDQ